MNAISTPNVAVIPNVPLGRFEAISISASTVAEHLQPLHEQNAKECVLALTTLQARLQEERRAAEVAIAAVAEARAEFKRVTSVGDILISTAVNVGRIFDFPEIADYANQDDAWLLTIEGLVSRFGARGEFGKMFADRFTELGAESRAANSELVRATDTAARANQSYSASYRELSSAVAFGRAVLARAGVQVAPVAKVAKKTKPASAPAKSTAVAAPVSVPVVP